MTIYACRPYVDGVDMVMMALQCQNITRNSPILRLLGYEGSVKKTNTFRVAGAYFERDECPGSTQAHKKFTENCNKSLIICRRSDNDVMCRTTL